jgi:hypothetical protein
MGWASERKAIESRLQTFWTTTPIKFENVPFAEQRDAYVALFLRHGDRSQLTLGASPTIQSVSAIIIQIFVPFDTGTQGPKEYADALAVIFDRMQFFTDDGDLISCLTASIESAGQNEEWMQYNVTIPYTREEN